MTIEILFQEVCGLYGDSQNPTYLQATLPDADFIFTTLTDTPYFVNKEPDRAVSENDIISVRGFGKYIIDRTGDVTRRGRIRLVARKYV